MPHPNDVLAGARGVVLARARGVVLAGARGVVLAGAFAVVLAGAFAAAGARARPGALPDVPPGFEIRTIAHVDGPRELAVSRHGDLFVGTLGSQILFVPSATTTPGDPVTFATVPDREAASVALDGHALFVGAFGGVYRIALDDDDRTARGRPVRIASVRPGGARGHETTSVAIARGRLFASVGSSCNACAETDPTRATILEMNLDGSGMHPKATHVRNAVALAVDPPTGALWAGVAGQDELEHGHPYEIFDDVGDRAGTADYGWPACYENRRAVDAGHDCSTQAVPRVVFPAYETPIGAAFYDAPPNAPHGFPAAYRNGAFVALHGSWHRPLVPPRVAFVPMLRDDPLARVDWNDPTVQWQTFVGGYQHDDGSRTGRPTGIAVASDGSLFVADDDAGAIYRIRPKR